MACFSVRAFTDGSSYGNPGPAGCGVVYQFPGQARKHTSLYLHHRASNNVAELHGILTACNRIRADLPDALAQIPQVFIFVDNQFAIKAANGQSRIRANKALVAIVQQSLADLRKLTPVTLMWVPGHADIGGNDVADALAKRGARGISSDQAPPATTPHIYVPAPSQAVSQGEEKDGQADPPYSRPTATPGTRQSKRPRPTSPLVEGIDFSLAQTGSQKKHKQTDTPITCPHGVLFDYSISNAAVDLPALSCPECKKSHQEAINIPHRQTEFYYAMHDPFDEHYDQMEHELDSDHAPQNGPWLNQLAFSGPTFDHDSQNDLFLSDF